MWADVHRAGRRLCGGRRGRLVIDHPQERIDDLGIELPQPLPVDFGDRLGDRPGGLVGPLLGERVEHVGDRDDPAGEWNLILSDARRSLRRPTARGG